MRLFKRGVPADQVRTGYPGPLGHSIDQGYETRDLSPAGIAAFGCAFLALMAVIFLGVSALTGVLSGKGPPLQYPPAGLANAPNPTLPAQPLLEAVPGENYRNFLATENSTLNSYGWVDRNAGIVHIPISRAIDIILARGLPARSAQDAQQFRDQGQTLPSGSSSGRVMEKVVP